MWQAGSIQRIYQFTQGLFVPSIISSEMLLINLLNKDMLRAYLNLYFEGLLLGCFFR